MIYVCLYLLIMAIIWPIFCYNEVFDIFHIKKYWIALALLWPIGLLLFIIGIVYKIIDVIKITLTGGY